NEGQADESSNFTHNFAPLKALSSANSLLRFVKRTPVNLFLALLISILNSNGSMKLTKTLVAQGHDGDEDGDDDAACGERIGRAETLCGCTGDEISEGHRADEREYKHAHHAPAH